MHIFTASLTACIQRRDALHPEILRGLAFEKRKAARCFCQRFRNRVEKTALSMPGIRKNGVTCIAIKREEERWKQKSASNPLRHLGLCADAD